MEVKCLSRAIGRQITQLQKVQHSRHSRQISTVLLTALMILFALYFLLPLIWLLISSTKSTNQLFSTGMLSIVRPFELARNLRNVTTYNSGEYWRWYANSIFYAVVTAILSTLVNALGGYAMAKYRFKGRGLVSGMILASLLIPGAALTIPVFLIIKDLGMMNTYAGVIVPAIASPFGIYFMNVYIGEAMPGELIDSGRVDGASEFQIFFRIALSIIRPGLVTYFLIAFVGQWNNFFLPLLILDDPNKFPLAVGLENGPDS